MRLAEQPKLTDNYQAIVEVNWISNLELNLIETEPLSLDFEFTVLIEFGIQISEFNKWKQCLGG